MGATAEPVVLTGARRLEAFARFGLDPVAGTRWIQRRYGDFVIFRNPLARSGQGTFGFVCDPTLYRVMVSDLATWRSVAIAISGIRNHASARLMRGFSRTRGAEAEHYRRVIAPPLMKSAVLELSPAMAQMTLAHVQGWPHNRELPLKRLTKRLAVDLAINLLFGDDPKRAQPIATMISKAFTSSWFLPTPGYVAWLTMASAQERAIVSWAEEKRGDTDARDLLSLLINAPDTDGGLADPRRVAGLFSFAFGAAFDTCQNAMAWTLILLTQYPKITAALTEELDAALGDAAPTMDRIGTLPLLDGVVNEAMRLFPPVPLQFRVAMQDTQLGAARLQVKSRICIATHLINRNPSIYEEPDSFAPERWTRLRPPPYENPIFSAGPRICPGSLYGMQMLKTALAAIVTTHRVELAPAARVDYGVTVTLSPRGRVGVILKDRRQPPVRSQLKGRMLQLLRLPAEA